MPLALGSLPCAAGPIATDRPDFVENSDVVGLGRAQIETSVEFAKARQDSLRTRNWVTPTLVRVGVSDTIEVRLETDGFTHQISNDAGTRESTHGFSDVAFGFKIHTQDGNEENFSPNLGWIFHIDTDSGSPAFRGYGWRPSLRLVAEWELPNEYSIGMMPGVYQEYNDDHKSYAGGIMAVVLGKSFTDRFRGLIEIAGQELAAPKNGGNVVTGNVGVAYLITPDVQIDCVARYGLSKQAPDQSYSVGLSIRF